MNHTDRLIYKLIFTDTNRYTIDVSKYLPPNELYKYESFIHKMKNIMKKADVSIYNEKTKIEISKVTWTFNTKKK